MNQDKKKKRIQMLTKVKATTAILLMIVLTLSPCIPLLLGNNIARAEEFKIVKRYEGKMIPKNNDTFFGEPMMFDLLYWMKTDGTPLFCIQKDATLVSDLDGIERSESYISEKYMTKKQYELISLVLQCCEQERRDKGDLEPGAYMAGQLAIWGIQSIYWDGTAKLKQEMENFYQHVIDWNNISAQTLISQSEEMIDFISQAINDYYSDMSVYIPSFASKYEDKAPIWKPQFIEDGSCEIMFELGEKNQEIKDFVYQLPDGWTYEWNENQIIFRCQNPQNGVILVKGTALEGSVLEKAFPIGLIYIVRPREYEDFQRLVSGIEVTTPWSCYFKLSISNPYYEGSWYLPEVSYYQHEEDFTAIYGVELEKTDGDTKEVLTGVEFQPMEYFDSKQLEGTVLDLTQIECWNGWKARCDVEITDEEGRLKHLDKKEYHYKKTYCGGHPEPIITFEGDFPARLEQLEEEAAQAWKEEVERCAKTCDFHSIDGSGKELLEEDRNLAYEQFTHLVYGYTFKETKPLEGYLPHGKNQKDKPIEKIFCISSQAGGEYEENKEVLEISSYQPQTVKSSKQPAKRVFIANIHTATASNAQKKTVENKDENQEKEEVEGTENIKKDKKTKPASSSIAEHIAEGQKSNFHHKALIWLTSLITPLIPEPISETLFYLFSVENYKSEKVPEETIPEETTPQETSPKETVPEETTLEETLPEESSPEESTPEETLPEETTPIETSPEETVTQETTTGETLPKETTKETTAAETTPEQTLPKETTKETTAAETTPEQTLPKETVKETSAAETTPEQTLPEETLPKETVKETTAAETTPEQTLPEETLPEESSWEETSSEETVPEEKSSEETTLQESSSKESESETSVPEKTPSKPSKSSGEGKGDKVQESSGVTETIGVQETISIPEETPSIIAITTTGSSKDLIRKAGKIQAVYQIPFVQGKAEENGQTFELIGDGEIPKGRLFIEKTGGDSGSSSGSGGSGNLKKRFPKTGDSGSSIMIFLFVTAGIGIIGIGLFLYRQRQKQKKNKQMFHAVFIPFLFILLCVQDVQAAEENQQDSQETKLILYFPIEEALEETKFEPESQYVDENGQKYQLEFCRQIENIIPERGEEVSEIIFYPGVEISSQIPETILFEGKEAESGMDGNGELNKSSVTAHTQYWIDGFHFPLTVYDYDADYYELQSHNIPKEGTLSFLLEHQQILLDAIGCSKDQYQINELVWDGEHYWEQGHLCRNAVGFGKKLVSDVSVEYRGEVYYPEWIKKQWQVVYSPIKEFPSETEAWIQSEAEQLEEVPEETQVLIQEVPVVQKEKRTHWSIIRTVVGYSIPFVVFIPFLFYLIRFFRKTNKDEDQIQEMEG